MMLIVFATLIVANIFLGLIATAAAKTPFALQIDTQDMCVPRIDLCPD